MKRRRDDLDRFTAGDITIMLVTLALCVALALWAGSGAECSATYPC